MYRSSQKIFDSKSTHQPIASLDTLGDVALELRVILGRTECSIRRLLALKVGSVLELNREAGEGFELLVNENSVAQGEVVTVNDHYGLRVTHIKDAESSL